MARRRSRRAEESRGRGWWWWLVVPLLGLAAYAAFDATLALVAPRDDTSQRVPPPRPALETEAPHRDSAPLALEEPAATPSPAAAAAGDVAPGEAVAPAATPTTARVASEAAAAQPKRKRAAPQEHLTDRDRRALEQLLDRAAAGQGRTAP